MRRHTDFLTMRLPPDLVRRLDAVATTRSASRASVVRALLQTGLDDLERLHARWAAEVSEMRRSRSGGER